jgi:hypothetical protein
LKSQQKEFAIFHPFIVATAVRRLGSCSNESRVVEAISASRVSSGLPASGISIAAEKGSLRVRDWN